MDGFPEFFAEHFAPVTRALSVAINDAVEAEELAQEAFTRALRRWRDVRAMERPATWVYVVAIREHGHRGKRAARAPRGEVNAGTDVFSEVDAAADFAQRVASLPPRQRVAVVLRFHANLSIDEIAQAMGCAAGTVKATLHAALKRLRVEACGEDAS